MSFILNVHVFFLIFYYGASAINLEIEEIRYFFSFTITSTSKGLCNREKSQNISVTSCFAFLFFREGSLQPNFLISESKC